MIHLKELLVAIEMHLAEEETLAAVAIVAGGVVAEIEEAGATQGLAIAEQGLEQGATAAANDFARLHPGPNQHLPFLLGAQFGQGGDLGAVLVAQRRAAEQIGQRKKASLFTAAGLGFGQGKDGTQAGLQGERFVGAHGRSTTASTSTRAPFGRAATCSAARAG